MPVLKASHFSRSPHTNSPPPSNLATHDADHANLWVGLKTLELNAIIGLKPSERLTPQPLKLSLSFEVDALDWIHAAKTGELQTTLDYSIVSQVVTEVIHYGEFRLIETIAWLIAKIYLRNPFQCENRPNIQRMRFSICKPHALSADGKIQPEISGELRPSDLSDEILSEALKTRFYDELGGDEAIELTLLLQLPEVTVVLLSTERSGLLTLNSDEKLISLGGDLLIEGEVVSWMSPMVALYLTKRSLDFDAPTSIELVGIS